MRTLAAVGIATVLLWAVAPHTVASAQQPAELDQLLAPIALYPDALLGQMLLCATTPGKIGALEEWLRSQEALKGTALQDAAIAAGFDQPLAAIVLFPDVVSMMASQMDWTVRLGEAFTADKSAVFAAIQRLRAKAAEAGTLTDTPQQNIETRSASDGQQVIVIEPANPQVVYVPQYNPQTVYTTSTVIVEDDDDDGAAVAAGVIGFTAGIALGAAMDNDYYYGPYGWGGGFYMYDDAWDDWYDHREDAREDWTEHREDAREDYADRRDDLAEERGERAGTAQEQRTERTEARQENRPETQAQVEQRRTERQASGTAATSAESRGYSRDAAKGSERSGTRSDAFSGYSSGRSERAASSRGQRSRSSSSRGGGGRRR
jgi:hypothetical protein